MIPTVDYIQQHFDTYNRQFFDGQLPPIPIKLSHAKGFLGKVTFTRKKQGLFRGYKNTDFVLRINARIDLPEELVQDTILHEMIHYYIAVNQLTDTSTHGALFRQHMQRINALGNRHITISHRLTEQQQSQAQIHKQRLVALVHFADGQIGIKIVPNQTRHRLEWQRRALAVFNRPNLRTHRGNSTASIDHIDWFLSDDPFYAKYPSSMALRIYLIPDPSVLPIP